MATPLDQHESYIAIWAKAVDTQMHFNEMSVKSRQLGLTFVAAALGVAVVLMTRGSDFVLKIPLTSPWFQLHVSVILILASALALWAVRTLDLNVYHRMLRGAVTFGEDFEEHYMKQIFSLNKGMTQAISHYSRHHNATKSTNSDTGVYEYNGTDDVTAEKKIKKFYNFTFIFLFGSAIGIFLITNLNVWIPKTPSTNNSGTTSTLPPAAKSNLADTSRKKGEIPNATITFNKLSRSQ